MKEPPRPTRNPVLAELSVSSRLIVILEFSAAARADVVVCRRIGHLLEKAYRAHKHFYFLSAHFRVTKALGPPHAAIANSDFV
jgi:hypothetical protein